MRVRLPLRIPRPLSSTVEQVTHNRLVVGSNPTGATNLCSISSIGQSSCLLSNWLQVRVLYAAPLWVVSSVGSSSGLLSHRSWVRVPHNPLRRTQRLHIMRMPVMTKDDAIMTAVALLLIVYAATGLEMLLITFLFLM